MRLHAIVHIDAGNYISIHAPVKGATRSGPRHYDGIRNFNPRTREGCDDFGYGKGYTYVKISIHAPVKGATLRMKKAKKYGIIFQSTHP